MLAHFSFGGSLPRPPSRGLIEGMVLGWGGGAGGPLFPGHRAGASLKASDFPDEDDLAIRISSPATEPGPH